MISVNIVNTIKTILTVADTARLVGLSRARFYQLQGTAFPFPVYDTVTRRPYYTEEQQQLCVEVRRRNCGIDGVPILFYARRPGAVSPKRTTKAVSKDKCDPEILDGVKALGMVSATSAQVAEAMRTLFPGGPSGVPVGHVIRGVFIRLRQNSADNVGR
jgi:hypothetical protein